MEWVKSREIPRYQDPGLGNGSDVKAHKPKISKKRDAGAENPAPVWVFYTQRASARRTKHTSLTFWSFSCEKSKIQLP